MYYGDYNITGIQTVSEKKHTMGFCAPYYFRGKCSPTPDEGAIVLIFGQHV